VLEESQLKCICVAIILHVLFLFKIIFVYANVKYVGRDSSVGIANELRAARSGDRIPVGEIFYAPVQAGPVVHPACYTIRTGSFPKVKRPVRDVDHPPASSTEVKERVHQSLYSPSGTSWPVIG
jgi:hypothetical protein